MKHNLQPGIHVAIIMDGNGRWALRRGLPRIAGYRAGVEAVRRVVSRAHEMGIDRLMLYAFSSDNWRRPAAEVQSIFWLLRAFLRLETNRLRAQGVRLQAIGRRDRIPMAALRAIEEAERATASCHRLELCVAIDYSSRDAITRAAASIIEAELLAIFSIQGLHKCWLVRAETSISLSALAERRGSLTSFCGNLPTRSSSLLIVCGLISMEWTWRRRCRNSNDATAHFGAIPLIVATQDSALCAG